MRRTEALRLVDQAREYAEARHHEGRLEYSAASPDCPTYMWLAALAEELGEVARCVHDGSDPDQLIAELAQLAGVAVGRIEALLP